MKNKHTKIKKIFIFIAFVSIIFGSNITSSYFQIPAIAQTQKNSKAEADRLRKQGEQQLEAGQYAQGTKILERSMRIYQQIRDTENVEKLKKLLTQIYIRFGSYDKIEQINGRSSDLYLGLFQMRKQNYAQARIYFEKAIHQSKYITGTQEREQQYIKILKSIGESYLYEQDYSKALSYLKQVESLTDDDYKVIRDDFGYSSCDSCRWTFDGPQDNQRKYLNLISKIKSRLSILLLIGEIYLQQGYPNKALNYFKKASTTATEYENALPEGIPIFWGNSSLHISRAYYSLGNYEQSINYAKKVLRIDKEIKTSRDVISSFYFPIGNLEEAHSHVLIGLALNKLGKLKEAEEKVERAIQIFESIRQKSILQTDIYENLKLFDNQVRATYFLQEILQGQNKTEAALSISEWGRSRLLLEESTIPKELSLNKKLDAIIDSAFSQMIDIFFDYRFPNTPASFRQSLKEKIIASSKDRCLASGQQEDCFKLVARKNFTFPQESSIENTLQINQHYRSIVQPEIKPPNVESLKQIVRSHQATIVEYSIISESTFFHNNATSIEQVKQWIKSESSIELSNSNPSVVDFLRGYDKTDYPLLSALASSAKIYNHAFVPWNAFPGKEQKLVIWVIKPTGEIQTRQIDLKAQKIPLKDLVANTRRTIRNHPGVQATKQLKQLHQLLIDPIADLLPTNPEAKVVFVPHKQLFLVPFAALIDSKEKYLIEKHTIITAPSIQALEVTRQKQQQQTEKSKLAVVVGNPTMPTITQPNSSSPIQLRNLPGSGTEGREVAKQLNTKLFTGNKATKAQVLKQLPNARYIHLATHGLLYDYAGFGIPGAIALAPSKQDNGLLTSSEIQELNLKAELAVLSACDTGRGDITGDGVVGLSRALIVAGVPSIVVSLWSVPDAPTAELMVEFYRNFQERKLDKAQALRKAMLKIMQTHPNPINWAAFTLIGEAEYSGS